MKPRKIKDRTMNAGDLALVFCLISIVCTALGYGLEAVRYFF